MTGHVARSDQEHFDDLQITPRKLGISNLLRFPTQGPGSIAILIFLFGMPIMGWMGTLEFFATRFMFLDTKTVTGQVVWVDETEASINDEYVYKTGYRYQVDGKQYDSYSYELGGSFEPGTDVTVVHTSLNPAISKIKGTRYSIVGWFHLIPAIFFLITLLQAAWGITQWTFLSRLLIRGKVSKATLKEKKDTGLRVNEGTIYKYIFDFDDDQGNRQELEVQTHDAEKITDDEWELVLYDPKNTSKAFLMDQLPFDVFLAEPGRWAPSPKGIPFVRLFLLGFAGFLASSAAARLMMNLFPS